MKRQLIQSNKIIPCTSGEVIDREGFISAIFAAKVSKGTLSAIEISHCDTSTGTFVKVPDPMVVVKHGPTGDIGEGDLANFDIDLVGCKRYIKITATLTGTDAAATYAVALGDSVEAPV